MTTTLHIEDATSPNQAAYLCHMQRGGVKAIAGARQSVIRKGAYEMSVNASNGQGRPLGSKQQQVAADLTLEAKGNLTRALYSAGWSSEKITWGGNEVILWWPKR